MRAFLPFFTRALPLVLLLASALPLPAAAEGPVMKLEVRPGDTLIGISQRLLRNPQRFTDIAKLNKLPNSNYIAPGQILLLPIGLLRGEADALIISQANGTVLLNGKSATVGQSVPEGATVTTAAGATATLKRGDGTQALLSPGSSIQVTENRALSNKGSFWNTVLRLATGSLDMNVTPSVLPEHVTVITSTSTIGVRGTSYRVGAGAASDAKPASRVEVLSGAVRTSAASNGGANDVALTGGFGTRVLQGEPPLKPVKLLDAPILALPKELDERLQRLSFTAVTGAAQYDVQVSPASDPSIELASARTNEPSLEFPNLPNGEYSVRVRAVDGLGLQGLDARSALRLSVSAVPTRLSATPTDSGHALSWRHSERSSVTFQLEVADSQDFSNMVVQGQLTTTLAQARDLPAGIYYWRVGVPNGSGGWRYSAVASFSQVR